MASAGGEESGSSNSGDHSMPRDDGDDDDSAGDRVLGGGASAGAQSLQLEARLSAPVLQLAAGRLDPAAPHTLALAVLHPTRLTVYALGAAAEGEAAAGRALRKLYEHWPHDCFWAQVVPSAQAAAGRGGGRWA